MFGAEKHICSIEELISNLERIELDQLESDIPANIRAELKYMRKNLTAVLSFVSHSDIRCQPADSELYQVMIAVRKECIALNGIISRVLVLQLLPIAPVKVVRFLPLAAVHYKNLSKATLDLCAVVAPQFTNSLAAAL